MALPRWSREWSSSLLWLSVGMSLVVDDFDVGIGVPRRRSAGAAPWPQNIATGSIENFLPTLSVALAVWTSRYAAKHHGKMNIPLIAKNLREHFLERGSRVRRTFHLERARVDFYVFLDRWDLSRRCLRCVTFFLFRYFSLRWIWRGLSRC